MYREHSVGVVVPAYNEEGRVGDVIREMPDYVDRMYVVDDQSSDGTWREIIEAAHDDRVAREADSGVEVSQAPGGDEFEWAEPAEEQLADDDPAERTVRSDGGDEELRSDGGERASGAGSSSELRSDGGLVSADPLQQRATIVEPVGRVVPLKHRENMGAGGAIKTGYLASLRDSLDVTATVDGDGQMDLSQMPKLLDPIVDDEADYAKGNRLLYKEYRSEMPRFRFIGNSILTFLTKISSGYWKTMDPQNGYTAISNYALENAGVEDMYEYYGYCNDLLVKLNAKGMRVADVAMPAVYGDEESSIDYATYIRKVSGMLLSNFLWRLKVKYLALDFHPLALFYIFGAGTAGLGVIGGLWSVYANFAMGASLFVRGTLSMMLFLIGSMFLMFAMLFDMQVNESKEVQIRE